MRRTDPSLTTRTTKTRSSRATALFTFPFINEFIGPPAFDAQMHFHIYRENDRQRKGGNINGQLQGVWIAGVFGTGRGRVKGRSRIAFIIAFVLVTFQLLPFPKRPMGWVGVLRSWQLSPKGPEPV